MKKLVPILAIYILIGWTVLIFQNFKLFFIEFPGYDKKQIMDTGRPKPQEIPAQNSYDKLAAMHIASARYKDAINMLIRLLESEARYNDNIVIKKFPLNVNVNPLRCWRYLHAIDSLSLIFRLGERLNIPESEMRNILSEYMEGVDHPESLQEYVVALEYRLSFRRFEDIDELFNRFRKYLHSNPWIEYHHPFLYYYPYLRGRFLLLSHEYREAEQYLGLALKFRPENNGIAYYDLVNVYLKTKQDEKARLAVNSQLDRPRDTAEFMFFKSLRR
ncbi:MAG: tetratricopeptide repeat protein [Candidatus Omnitrophica bacterium]|nr:tetratricopeptide repeat protein [Candidatus Omnitrophota bacterium]